MVTETTLIRDHLPPGWVLIEEPYLLSLFYGAGLGVFLDVGGGSPTVTAAQGGALRSTLAQLARVGLAGWYSAWFVRTSRHPRGWGIELTPPVL